MPFLEDVGREFADIGMAFSGVGRDYVKGLMLKQQQENLGKELKLNELMTEAKIKAMQRQADVEERKTKMLEAAATREQEMFPNLLAIGKTQAGEAEERLGMVRALSRPESMTEEQKVFMGVKQPGKSLDEWQQWITKIPDNKMSPAEKAAYISRFNQQPSDADAIGISAARSMYERGVIGQAEFQKTIREVTEGKNKLAEAISKINAGREAKEELYSNTTAPQKLEDYLNKLNMSDEENKADLGIKAVSDFNRAQAGRSKKGQEYKWDYSYAQPFLKELQKEWDKEALAAIKSDLEGWFKRFKTNAPGSQFTQETLDTVRSLTDTYVDRLTQDGVPLDHAEQIVAGWFSSPRSELNKYLTKRQKTQTKEPTPSKEYQGMPSYGTPPAR